MNKLNDKAFKILSLMLLAEQPLTTKKLSELVGYPRKTTDLYVTKFLVQGLFIDVGRDGAHGWIINEKHRPAIIDAVITFSGAIENESKSILQRYNRNPIWVHLIDADSKIPNLALMKLSTFYKAHGDRVTMSKGDEVGFCRNVPDKVYVSIVFKKNAHMFDDLASYYPDTTIDIGGSGVDLKKVLPPEIENMKPDYSLYPKNNASIGFSSRGCFRKCYFCIVGQKEGKFRRTEHPEKWYNPAFKNITFLDNNILADPIWFLEITDWCISKDLKIWFTQGLDLRLVDIEIAKRLYEIRNHRMLSFAWDNIKDERVIKQKIALLRDAGFTKNMLRAHVQFYIYVDKDEEYESGLYRCNELKQLGCNAFVMYNIDNERTTRIKALQCWANRKQLFWQFDIDDYKKDTRVTSPHVSC